MLGTINTPSGSKKRSLDAEINLVPFIDLLSMCICFLLMTAVWVEVATLEVKQSHGTEASAPTSSFEMNVRFSGPAALEIAVKKNGKSFKRRAFSTKTSEELSLALDSQLSEFLATLDKRHPQEPGLISAAFVTARQDIAYGQLVSVLDVLRKHHVVNLGVLAAGVQIS